MSLAPCCRRNKLHTLAPSYSPLKLPPPSMPSPPSPSWPALPPGETGRCSSPIACSAQIRGYCERPERQQQLQATTVSPHPCSSRRRHILVTSTLSLTSTHTFCQRSCSSFLWPRSVAASRSRTSFTWRLDSSTTEHRVRYRAGISGWASPKQGLRGHSGRVGLLNHRAQGAVQSGDLGLGIA